MGPGRLGLVVTLCVAGACGGPGKGALNLPADAAPLPFERLLAEQYSGVGEARRAVIHGAGEWGAFWEEATGHTGRLAAPAVDFTRDMVIVAAMGQRATGGYGITIESVARARRGLYVVVREVSPGPGCAVTEALTAPLDVVRVAKWDGPVSFVERKEEGRC